MSVCVSPAGEYSEHELGQVCPRCGAWNPDSPALIYVTTAWGQVYASLEGAKRGCDEYLTRCYSHGEPHVEDGTDEAGWFQFGEPPSLREWRRFFTDRDHADPLHFPPQSIREAVLHDSVRCPIHDGARCTCPDSLSGGVA